MCASVRRSSSSRRRRWGLFLATFLVGCGGHISEEANALLPSEGQPSDQELLQQDAEQRYVAAVCACSGSSSCAKQTSEEAAGGDPACLYEWAQVYRRTCTGKADVGEVSASCGGPVAACQRVHDFAATLIADGCAEPSDTAQADASNDPATCIAFTAKYDACARDAQCAQDMSDRLAEACHAPAPVWSAP